MVGRCGIRRCRKPVRRVFSPNGQFQNHSTDATHTNGFEWCINAPAVDVAGNVYANSEDGSLYVIRQGGTGLGQIFLNQALGAAYTPLSLGPDGRIYTENDGILFAVGQQ